MDQLLQHDDDGRVLFHAETMLDGEPHQSAAMFIENKYSPITKKNASIHNE